MDAPIRQFALGVQTLFAAVSLELKAREVDLPEPLNGLVGHQNLNPGPTKTPDVSFLSQRRPYIQANRFTALPSTSPPSRARKSDHEDPTQRALG
jgi:hypothetical protein